MLTSLRSVVGGLALSLAVAPVGPAWAAWAADSTSCQIVGSWNAIYTWQGGGSRGSIAFTLHGSDFVGTTIGGEIGAAGSETIRGKLSEGKIREVEVFHSRRGWVRARFSSDDACSTITLDLPDATVTLIR